MTDFKASLSAQGYQYHESERVWARDQARSFGYSDGDQTEEALYQTLCNAADVSSFSRELQAACVDWPSTYHFSPARGNLLRPVAHRLRGDILEIGAGCGAITRFLGENGANVLALEGSTRRAKIAAQRTRDLNNVTVVSEKFENLAADLRFDVITLIGVLEYAGVFNEGQSPAQQMLQAAQRLLKPGGILIIAIENQLGLKYLAGVPEDHLGVPMLGVQGMYPQPGVETFGRQVLHQMLEQAGFSQIELALPFPDYKLPISVILPAGYGGNSGGNSGFDGAALAALVSARDAQVSSRHVTFSMERAWRVVGKNGLLADLANSFLFVASTPTAESARVFDDKVLALHYSTARQPAFCKAAKFYLGGNSEICVENSLVNPQATPVPSPDPAAYTHTLHQEPFFAGKLLSDDFIKTFQTPGWTAKDIAALLEHYLRMVRECAGKSGNGPIDLEEEIPGQYLDLIPSNIIQFEGGEYQAIDQEWRHQGNITLGYLAFRVLGISIGMMSSLAIPADLRWLENGRLFEDVFSHFGVDLLESSFEKFAAKDTEFMCFVAARDIRYSPYRDWHSWRIPTYLDRSNTSTSWVDRLVSLENLAAEYRQQINALELEKASLHQQLAQFHGWRALARALVRALIRRK